MKGIETTLCRAKECRASIVYLKTKTGKRMPTDAATVKPGDEFFEFGRHTSHYATCKDPKRFRRRK